MYVDISKYVDASNERSPAWHHMLLNKEKGEAICKLCLDKKVTRTVYAKNGSTKTILDHLRLIHGIGIGNNAALFNDPSQKSCLEVFQEEVRSSLSDKTLSNLLFLNRHFKKFSVIMKGTQG